MLQPVADNDNDDHYDEDDDADSNQRHSTRGDYWKTNTTEVSQGWMEHEIWGFLWECNELGGKKESLRISRV